MEITIGWGLAFIANTLVAFLFWQWRTLVSDLKQVKREMAELQVNYLDRFDDLKDVIGKANLEIMQRIAILETKLCSQLKFK